MIRLREKHKKAHSVGPIPAQGTGHVSRTLGASSNIEVLLRAPALAVNRVGSGDWGDVRRRRRPRAALPHAWAARKRDPCFGAGTGASALVSARGVMMRLMVFNPRRRTLLCMVYILLEILPADLNAPSLVLVKHH